MAIDTQKAMEEIMKDPMPTVFALSLAAFVVIFSCVSYYVYVVVLKKKVALNPGEFRRFQLIEKTSLSPNVVRIKFALQTARTVLGLPIGQHITIQGVDEDGKEFTRPYTPVSLDSDVGRVDFVIKLYPDGAMSKYVSKLNEGDFVKMRGPKGRFQYKKNMEVHFGMIAGGSGITPMYQVARAVLEDPEEKTKITLITANVTEEDILLRDQLDNFAKEHPGRFTVHYVLNKPPDGWKGGIGFVSKEMIQAKFPPPSNDIKVLYCGPPPMNNAMKTVLQELGYDTFKF